MADSQQGHSPTDVRRITRRLTGFLARVEGPPKRVEVQVGKGYHLLLGGAGRRLLHITILSKDLADRGAVSTASASLQFRCAGDPTPAERRWIAALGRGLRLMEQEPDWPGFLGWSDREPAVMLPDATFDPQSDPSTGNIELIRLETRCNGRCAFCSARGILPDLVLDAELIVERLRSMRSVGRQNVAFTGGEPTLRADLPELVDRARREGFTAISLVTNGMRLDKGPLLDQLVEAGLTSVFVPLLSHEEETHDALLGVRGAFARTVAGIDRCRAAGLQMSYNTVITTRNLVGLVPYVAWLAQRFPADRLTGNFSYIALQGWALDHLELVPRLEAVRPHLRGALDLCDQLGLEITVPGICGVPMCLLPGYEPHFEEFHRGYQGVPENRRYAAVCDACDLRERCSGFWTIYLDRYGEAELGYPAGFVPSR